MPELPEVETTLRGIAPHLRGQTVRQVVIRQERLRWPVPAAIRHTLPGQPIRDIRRRAKYLLIDLPNGTLLLHLGMSGSLRILPVDTLPGRHDHFDLLFDDFCLRLRDPRRFGAVLWTREPVERHPLIRHLGPEPLGESFTGAYLQEQGRARRTPVKNLIMDGRVVVGVGNIYASEALFLAGIHPGRPASRISPARYRELAARIRELLERAIRQGGTTLRDFHREDGRPGYFTQELNVYGRAGEPCPRCNSPVKRRLIGQRSTFYCGRCQR